VDFSLPGTKVQRNEKTEHTHAHIIPNTVFLRITD